MVRVRLVRCPCLSVQALCRGGRARASCLFAVWLWALWLALVSGLRAVRAVGPSVLGLAWVVVPLPGLGVGSGLSASAGRALRGPGRLFYTAL